MSTETKYERFLKYMHRIAELFDRELSESVISLYWEALKDNSDQDIMKAFNLAVKSCKFFPKPAELIEFIEGDNKDQGLLAWEKVYKAIRSVGSYQSVRFDDQAIHSCIELMGGWPMLCQSRVDEMKWKQKEFEALYKVMVKRGDHKPCLPGIAELQNGAKGYGIQPPVFIGERGEVKQLKNVKALKGAS